MFLKLFMDYFFSTEYMWWHVGDMLWWLYCMCRSPVLVVWCFFWKKQMHRGWGWWWINAITSY